MQQQDIQQDPFVIGLKERLPSDLQDSFSNEQLEALKIAFGARRWGQHSVDLRGTFRLWSWRYYFVFLAGRNKRERSRVQEELSSIAKAFAMAVFLVFCVGCGLVILYLIKSALGINLFPDFSLGLWTEFKRLFDS
ncbi:hypothetical protein IQ22_03024 [Pseudomonas duriflava]|uniref:3-phosphoshikimate 1-carboxyvinyltransferase n=1 Tax=Pseudomonas duriflava TaxID=459528 RepID=A0A562Q8U1_9PSED|nr:3-phosphoshikimate 1-carboxyvinyltransferase [Pseudomonas duriflava]TWI53177.1 hypothetical protein IQ22_03024 [Pseudomonas duriflava]